MLKTFYLKNVRALEARKRIENLGLAFYNVALDVDERLNALTVNTPHENLMKQVEDFIAGIDADAPPGPQRE